MYRFSLVALASFMFFASGCASPSSIQNTNSDVGAVNASFQNFLVIGIADNYTNRAQYERTVVSLLKNRGASATAYYEAVGGNKPINRESVREVVAADSFDAVLVTRVLDRQSELEVKGGSPTAKITRREDRPIDFFRYDYEELDEPGSIEIRTEAKLAAELYNAADESLVWSTEVSSKGAESIGELIDEVAEKVVQRLQRKNRIAR